MRDIYLRLDDEASWLALAASPALQPEPGVLEIDVVGVIELVTFDGETVSREILPGWHVNIRCRDDRDLSALASHQVHPAAPSRLWLS